jgi:hypothetical protein
MTPAEVMAQHIMGSGYTNLPVTVIETAKRLILDAFATTSGGSRTPWCRLLVEQAREWGGGEESTILPV